MRTFAITGGEVVTPDGLRPGTVVVTAGVIDGVIDGVTDASAIAPVDLGPDDGRPLIDASGLIVSPGFVDLQINGGFGLDLVARPEAMWELGRQLPQHGVTGFLPTIITAPATTRSAALEAIGQRPVDHLGAEPLGLHFEGPMLSPRRPGAHPPHHLVQPDPELLEGWSADDGVLLVTVAPELPGATEVIAQLVSRGVTVSAGHSDASAEQARAGMAAGVTMVTHLFNAMAPLNHRQPNLVGVALAADQLSVGLIVDGVHVDPTVVAATWKAKRPSGVILVTDAVAPMGQEPGRYHFAGSAITVADGAVRNEAGTLAGSVLTMDRAVRNLIDYTGCSPADALAAASTTPAAVIGAADRGRIQPGARADLTLLDRDLQVQLTLCNGHPAYVADGAGDRLADELSGSE